jgi:hypothetical protein
MLSGEAASRAQRALALRSGRGDIDLAASRARFADLLKQPTAGVMA